MARPSVVHSLRVTARNLTSRIARYNIKYLQRNATGPAATVPLSQCPKLVQKVLQGLGWHVSLWKMHSATRVGGLGSRNLLCFRDNIWFARFYCVRKHEHWLNSIDGKTNFFALSLQSDEFFRIFNYSERSIIGRL
ncbi:hypothetical protein TNCV_478571 [Trichonephila clavipes]|nr:hypothetical protein TNCV_478571 [Trichonephila clavipes]